MDNLILTLAARWLHASDAIAAVQVCKEWNEALQSSTDNGNLWYQCCLNTNPLATAQIHSTDMDYRRLTLGFIRKVTCDVSSQNKLPASLSGAQDVFAVIDLYRNPMDMNGNHSTDIEASWVCPLVNGETNITIQDLQDTVLKAMNPYSRDSQQEWQHASSSNGATPLKRAIHSLTGSAFTGNELCAKVTLFRRHDMKSVCVVDSAFAAIAYVESSTSRHVFLTCSGMQPLLANDKNATIQDDYMSTIIQFKLSPDLAPPQSPDETNWLVDSRPFPFHDCMYEPDDEALEALSSIPYFGFRMQQVSLKFMCDARDEDDAMTAMLDSLCWK